MKSTISTVCNEMLLLPCVALLCSTASAQWYWQNPLPQGNTLKSIMFVNQQIGWAGSGGGSLLKTTDGGDSWHVVVLPTRVFVEDIFFINEQRGWIGGEPYAGGFGILLGTTDGGTHWTTQLEDDNGDFQTIVFANERQGWAAGQFARIYHTTDGGNSWQLQTDFYPSIPWVYSFSFIDSLQGWGAAGKLLRTTNGGADWAIDTTLQWGVLDIDFVDTLQGWAAGNGKIAYTTNKGQTWQVQVDTFSTIRWEDLKPLNSVNAWAVSNTGLIVKTTNRGAKWTYQENPLAGSTVNKQLRGIAFKDSSSGFAVGNFGALIATTNGGDVWQSLSKSTASQDLFGLHFMDLYNGWAAGLGGAVVTTSDGGRTWSSISTGIDEGLYDVWFVSRQLGWVVGSNIVRRTTNGGASWTLQPAPVNRIWVDIEFSYYPEGWIVGSDVLSDGRLLKTTDGGNSWIEVTSIVLPYSTQRVQFTSPDTGWIMAGNSTLGTTQAIYRTTNSGLSWETMLLKNSDTAFAAMAFATSSTGWVSTLARSIYKTSDGGNTWRVFVTPEGFYSLSFISNEVGWGGAFSGEVYRTENGGQTWTPQFCPMESPVKQVRFVNQSTGWIVGYGGDILYTSNGGVSSVLHSNHKVLSHTQFHLDNNRPNPFNSSTTIQLDLYDPPRNGYLSIYDILGREIYKQSFQPTLGQNEVIWRGENANGKVVASGVYICAVTINGITRTRKMLLIR